MPTWMILALVGLGVYAANRMGEEQDARRTVADDLQKWAIEAYREGNKELAMKIIEGLESAGFEEKAQAVRAALFEA